MKELQPFGELACEKDLEKLGGEKEYSKYFFYNTPFNKKALDKSVYLIIGRRGSGKTALSHYFSFQSEHPNSITIDVDEPEAYQRVMASIDSKDSLSREIAIPQLVKIWELIFWSILIRELRNRDKRIKAACLLEPENGKTSTFIVKLIKSLVSKYTQTKEELTDELEKLISSDRIEAAKEAIYEIAKKQDIIISFDTLENYAVKDESMMRVIASLIQSVSHFHDRSSQHNIQMKLFVMAEILPYLHEEIVLNPLKSIANEVYLHWRPRDLLRLISWRFWHYMKAVGMDRVEEESINWDDYNDVLKKCWQPFFGKELSNGGGLTENTFPYVLRHTQMRPRQLILYCNNVAEKARSKGTFPFFDSNDLVGGVRDGEVRLAKEVFNSYSTVYPNAAQIADALTGMPPIFEGKELDKVAPHTSSVWKDGNYSPYEFRRFVAELGIVGRVRKLHERSGIVEADFEYAQDDRLAITVKDICVIHPMFYKKLNIKMDVDHEKLPISMNNMNKKIIVYPFPDRPEYKELIHTP